jgi:hypothetical protein
VTQEQIKMRKDANIPVSEDFSYCLYDKIYDLKADKVKFLAGYDYDSQGKLINSWSVSESEVKWNNVVPNSIGEDILRTIRVYINE